MTNIPPGSPMHALMEHVAVARPALPSGVAPMSVRLPPEYDSTPDLIAASLAGGMIAAGGKAVTAEEAVGVFGEVREILRRQPNVLDLSLVESDPCVSK